MFKRTQHILENFGEIVDINYIKEITKDKDKKKINLCVEKIVGHNKLYRYIESYSKYYVYKNIYIKFCYDKIILCDKDRKYVIYNSKWDDLFHFKYCCEKNDIIKKTYYKTALQTIQIYKNKYIKYSYEYLGKIKNDKYKTNYRLPYICFALLFLIELIFHIYI
jgi:hypothetical protein